MAAGITATLRTWFRHWLLGPETHDQVAAAQAGSITQPMWCAVPGGRLELLMTKLSGCGFAIHIDPTPDRALYTLYTPEGERFAWGHNLQALKDLGEKLARERTEFDAPLPRAPRLPRG